MQHLSLGPKPKGRRPRARMGFLERVATPYPPARGFGERYEELT